jgi:hypothetical protein
VAPTVDALAAALPIARTQAAALSEAARARYLTTFSPDVVLSELIAIYEKTAADGVRG